MLDVRNGIVGSELVARLWTINVDVDVDVDVNVDVEAKRSVSCRRINTEELKS